VIREPDVQNAEGGFTLTEVLAALIILGVAITAILAAMGTSIITADTHRKLVSDDAILRSYAEQLQSAPFVECATPAQYPTFSDPPPQSWANYQATITAVDSWNTSASPANGVTFGGTCTNGTAGAGLQRIQLQAASTSGRGGLQTLTILKRRSG
jgi:prepilin-type N-terminal cleavage/methylation domain-containing protein